MLWTQVQITLFLMNIHGTLLQMFYILNHLQVLVIHIVEIQLTAHLMMLLHLKTTLLRYLLGTQSSQNFKLTIFTFQVNLMLESMFLILLGKLINIT